MYRVRYRSVLSNLSSICKSSCCSDNILDITQLWFYFFHSIPPPPFSALNSHTVTSSAPNYTFSALNSTCMLQLSILCPFPNFNLTGTWCAGLLRTSQNLKNSKNENFEFLLPTLTLILLTHLANELFSPCSIHAVRCNSHS